MIMVGSLSLTSTSNTDTIRAVSRDVKAGFIGFSNFKVPIFSISNN